MKYICKLLLAVLPLGVLAAGCDDSISNEYGIDATLRIVHSDVSYPVEGANGVIEIEKLTEGNVGVSTDQSWCKASISGNNITVTTDMNQSLASRSAQVYITLGGYSTSVGIYQKGVIFAHNYEIETFGWESGETQAIVLSDALFPVEIVSVPSWLTADFSNGKLVITTIQSNPNMTAARQGAVRIRMLDIEKNIMVTQKEMSLSYETLIGTWKMSYYDASSAYQETIVTLEARDAGSLLMRGLAYPAVFTYNQGSLEIYAGQVVGTYTTGGVNYDIYVRITDDASSSNNTSSAGMYTTAEMVDGQLVLTFVNNGVYATGTGFAFYRTVNSSNTYYAKYRTSVKLYKQP